MFRQADGAAMSRLRRTRKNTARGRRITAVLFSVLAVGATLLVSAPTAQAKPAPPNPSDAQLAAAAQAKTQTATLVGQLSAQLAQAQAQVIALHAKAELAEQKYALALSLLTQAKQESAVAQAAVQAAAKQVQQARSQLKSFVTNAYLTPINGTAGNLLTAKDPSSLLTTGDYQQFVSARHLSATSRLDLATVAKSNADAKAKAAVLLQQKRTTDADTAQQAAKAAYLAEQQQAASLATQRAATQKQLEAAQLKLATLNNQRATYIAYQKEQARIAAEKARQAALRAAAARAAQLAAMQAAQNNGGGGGGDGTVAQPAPTGGSCGSGTAGQRAACWALKWLGTPYAWAGGNAGGPTYGVDSPGTDGWNDHTVYGFDCSGLTLYAWAHEGIYMAHYAATQFSQAGSYHPSPGNYQVGDLLFWGLPGQGDIHHVAMYIGGGNVIQAPNSGSYVQITPWQDVSGDYFGATRPGT